jgi:hypothetical protein
MNYFTPSLLERFASEDNRVALAAQEELERRSEQYAEHLRTITGKLPPRFRELQERFYLHDARVAALASPWFPPEFLPNFAPMMPWGFPFWGGLPEGEPGRRQSLWIALQLDTPPREFVVLHYRTARLEEVSRHLPGNGDGSPCLEWQHDEVDLIPGEAPEVRHSILFSNGLELRLRFADFDFATLKPLQPAGTAPAGG